MPRSGSSQDSRFVRFHGPEGAEFAAIPCEVITSQVTGHLPGRDKPVTWCGPGWLGTDAHHSERVVVITSLSVRASSCAEITSAPSRGGGGRQDPFGTQD